MGWKEKIVGKGKKLFEDVKETVDVLTPPDQEQEHQHTHEPEMTISEPCNFWCFILGVGCSITCPLPKGHQGDHKIGLTMVNEPKCHFEITWNMDE